MKLLNLKGIFFGKKNQKNELKKAEEMLQLYVKYIPQLRKIMREEDQGSSDGEIIGQMYDFYKDVDALTENRFITGATFNSSGGIVDTDNRKEVTPLSVMNELETVPTPFTVENLDEKIATLKDKSKLINQRFAKAQIDGLIKRLENRKKYEDNFSFYNKFPNTTDSNIDKLLEKYKLVMDTSDKFVPSFPKDAIEIMKEYTAITKKISGEKPVYYVIAEKSDFEKKVKKLDPILLAQSPFGFYWQICGAWDKEMLLLSEL